jgi:triosephosphate isomerase (TIM)
MLCVGETGQERASGLTEEIVSTQIERVLQKVGVQAFANAVVAYEPVWAIGTGITASPAQAQAVHALIRAGMAGHDGEIAGKVRIVYGGSVNATNAADLIVEADIDGALVGGASLIAEQFVSICRSMSKNKDALRT